MTTNDAWAIATSILPPTVLTKIEHQPAERGALCTDIGRYVQATTTRLIEHTETCLRNMERVSFGRGPDAALTLVLVPELWERICPGIRTYLRRIRCTLAEQKRDSSRLSIFCRVLSEAQLAALDQEADLLRAEISRVAALDLGALIERVRFAVAGSAARRFDPAYPVYEAAFTYRLVPAIVHRARTTPPGAPG